MSDEKTQSAGTIEEPAITRESLHERGRSRRIVAVRGVAGLFAHGFTRQEAKAWRKACAEAAGSIEDDEYSDERFVVAMIHDGRGRRVFTDQDVLLLADYCEAEWTPLYMACVEANGWGALGVERLRKNSEPTRTSGSGSGSQPGTESQT